MKTEEIMMSEDDIRIMQTEDATLRQKLNGIIQRRPLTFKDLNDKLPKEGRLLSVVL
jgi:hypothetical protein